MMQDQAIRTLGSVCGVALLFGALIAACAGGNTPARTDELEQLIEDTFTNGGQVGAGAGAGAGGAGAGGSSGSGTGGSGGGTAAGGTSGGGCDGFVLLQESCGGAACHSAPTAGFLTNFALDEATAEALEGQPPSGSSCTTDSAPVFDSANAAASLVMKKINGSATCGGRMPPGNGPYLEQAEVACIQSWIESL